MKVSRVPVSDGVTLNVHRWPGSATRFLLVHGLSSNARLWDGVAGALAAHGHAVVAADLRGHGRSDKPDSGYDYATVVADLMEVLGALEWERPVVVGQSWGGNVAVELAARHPSAVRGVAGVDGGWIDLSHFATWDECVRALSPPRTEGLQAGEVEAMLRSRHPDWPESGIQGALASFEQRPDGTVAPWLTRDRHLMILRHLWEQRPTSVYPKVGAPVLLLPCEDAGPAVGRKREEVAAAERGLPVSRTSWLKADHDAHAQYPTQVAELLVGCLADGFFP